MPTKKTFSLLLALVFLLLLVLWLISGQFLSSREEAPPPPPPEEEEAFLVETRSIQAQEFQPQLQLQGQLQASQSLVLKAETSSRVTRLPVAEGEAAEAGETLLHLAADSRPQEIQRLEAERARRAAELQAAERLVEGGNLALTEYLRLQSSLLQIEADLKSAQLDLQHTRPQAPFSGYLEELLVEIGDAVQPGQQLARLINTRQLRALARVPQKSIDQVSEGQVVTLELLDGQQLTGEVVFVGRQADPQTRTFRLEAQIDNSGQQRLAGASATLRVQLPRTQAHYLAASLLSLNEEGYLGIKHLVDNQQVAWTRVEVLSNDTSGVWVAGLPEQLEVITLGGGFVKEGDTVRTRTATTAEASE
ncbi:efflux RND transporter periplasmic adaptor subunit [Marinospirillum perlucidum]|uniref:efflux RND transporter periplasmic adaptor subunit n=1 Tax=Marinospirillum perlucidum TaxID=1982602 RepID=UPI00138FE882|nr:efflux RND transporter periplasmic adaptor subunit [Marinospirillum perlucidum]